MAPQLVHFVDGNAEFVVIDDRDLTRAQLEDEYEATVKEILVVHGCVSGFPTDRELRAN